MSTNLQNTLRKIFSGAAAQDLTHLVADYQAAQAAQWLISAIEPMAQELREKLPQLEQDKTKAYERWKATAESEYESVDTGHIADLQHSRYVTVFREFSDIQGKLARLDRILAELGEVTPPPHEAIREIVKKRE